MDSPAYGCDGLQIRMLLDSVDFLKIWNPMDFQTHFDVRFNFPFEKHIIIHCSPPLATQK